MKTTIVSLLIVLMVMIALPMIFLSDGEYAKQLGFGDFGGKKAISARLPQNIKTVVTDKLVEVYTWVDEHGIKQFSSTPPAEGGPSEKLVLSPNMNVMDPIKISEEEETVASRPRVYSIGSPYTSGGIKDVFDNSKDAQQGENQRLAEQERIIKEMFPQMKLDK